MDSLIISGGRRLEGVLAAAGSKNAALPILAATLLTHETCTLSRVPVLRDVSTMLTLLSSLGVSVRQGESSVVEVQAESVEHLKAPYDLVKTMRASILVLGPLLARYGKAEVSFPGGCSIGSRPVDLHIRSLEAMGATVTVISSSDKKLTKIRELGADYTVNYTEHPQWSDRVNELLDGEHIDLAIELGGAVTLAQTLQCLRVGGRISVIGVLSGNEAQLVISDILRKWVSLNGITVSHREDFRAMNRFMAAHGIKPVIDHEVPFEHAETAYRELGAGQHFGKIVIAHQ